MARQRSQAQHCQQAQLLTPLHLRWYLVFACRATIFLIILLTETNRCLQARFKQAQGPAGSETKSETWSCLRRGISAAARRRLLSRCCDHCQPLAVARSRGDALRAFTTSCGVGALLLLHVLGEECEWWQKQRFGEKREKKKDRANDT